MCNAIPILSPFFLYHPSIPHSLIGRSFYFLVSLLFLCLHAYIKSSGFIGGKRQGFNLKNENDKKKKKKKNWRNGLLPYLPC